MPEIVILAGAENDILELYVRFENIQDGLGDRFALRIDETLAMIGSNPRIGTSFRGEIRRCLVKGFPHGVFYSIEARGIIVQTVLDLRQSPEGILRRLENP